MHVTVTGEMERTFSIIQSNVIVSVVAATLLLVLIVVVVEMLLSLLSTSIQLTVE